MCSGLNYVFCLKLSLSDEAEDLGNIPFSMGSLGVVVWIVAWEEVITTTLVSTKPNVFPTGQSCCLRAKSFVQKIYSKSEHVGSFVTSELKAT